MEFVLNFFVVMKLKRVEKKSTEESIAVDDNVELPGDAIGNGMFFDIKIKFLHHPINGYFRVILPERHQVTFVKWLLRHG